MSNIASRFQNLDTSTSNHDPSDVDEKHDWLDNPWDLQHKEPVKAFAAFSVYKNMNPLDRTVLGAARILKGLPHLETVPSRILLWYKNWRWKERAREWDRFKAKQADEAEIERVRKLAEERVNGFSLMVKAGMTIVAKADLNKMEENQARLFLYLVPHLITAGAAGQRAELGLDVWNAMGGQQVGRGSTRVVDDAPPPPINLEQLEAMVSKSGNFLLPPSSD